MSFLMLCAKAYFAYHRKKRVLFMFYVHLRVDTKIVF